VIIVGACKRKVWAVSGFNWCVLFSPHRLSKLIA